MNDLDRPRLGHAWHRFDRADPVADSAVSTRLETPDSLTRPRSNFAASDRNSTVPGRTSNARSMRIVRPMLNTNTYPVDLRPGIHGLRPRRRPFVTRIAGLGRRDRSPRPLSADPQRGDSRGLGGLGARIQPRAVDPGAGGPGRATSSDWTGIGRLVGLATLVPIGLSCPDHPRRGRSRTTLAAMQSEAQAIRPGIGAVMVLILRRHPDRLGSRSCWAWTIDAGPSPSPSLLPFLGSSGFPIALPGRAS